MKFRIYLLRSILLFSLFLISTVSFAQTNDKALYSGGMLIYQPGYLITDNNYQEIGSSSIGLGGILRIYPKPWLAVGIYGGSKKSTYSSTQSNNSYISLSYGGPLVGVTHKTGRMRYSLSAFVGHATIRNLHIEKQEEHILLDAYLSKTNTLIYTPILSVDYAITQRLYATLQTVCLTAKYGSNQMLYNPTVQLGLLFSR